MELDTTKSGSGSFSSDWLRFFRIKGAFCLLMRKVLRHEELAAGARYNYKKSALSQGAFFIVTPPHEYTPPSIHLNISAIFQIYRLTDNSRQAYTPYIPRPHQQITKTKKLSHICDSSFIVHMQLMPLKLLLHLNLLL